MVARWHQVLTIERGSLSRKAAACSAPELAPPFGFCDSHRAKRAAVGVLRNDLDVWEAMREEERRHAGLLTKRTLQLLALATVVTAAGLFAVGSAFGIGHAVAAALIVGPAAAIATRP
jgi:hypothetical protein